MIRRCCWSRRVMGDRSGSLAPWVVCIQRSKLLRIQGLIMMPATMCGKRSSSVTRSIGHKKNIQRAQSQTKPNTNAYLLGIEVHDTHTVARGQTKGTAIPTQVATQPLQLIQPAVDDGRDHLIEPPRVDVTAGVAARFSLQYRGDNGFVHASLRDTAVI